MLVVTTPFVPGHRVVEVRGLCFGLVVRSRGIGPNIAAAFRSLGERFLQLPLGEVEHVAVADLVAA